jgi:hypothetical protein
MEVTGTSRNATNNTKHVGNEEDLTLDLCGTPQLGIGVGYELKPSLTVTVI